MVSDVIDSRVSARGLHTEAIKPLFGFNEFGTPSFDGGIGLRSLFSGPCLFFFPQCSFTFFRLMCVRGCSSARSLTMSVLVGGQGGGGVPVVAAPIHRYMHTYIHNIHKYLDNIYKHVYVYTCEKIPHVVEIWLKANLA